MPRAYKITHLPEGYCTLAIAAWKSLTELELFEIDGKLVFTDGIAEYLLGEEMTGHSVHEFDSHAEFEKWLLDTVSEWIKHDPIMTEYLDQYLKLA